MELEEALKILRDSVKPATDKIDLPLADSFGHIIAQDLTAKVNVPSFDRSAMDGYAVSSEDIKDASYDTPVILDVVGEVFAGDMTDIRYTPLSAVRVMTGGMLPEGYDTVVRQEDTDMGDDRVSIFTSLSPYTNYCHEGEEIKSGEAVLKAGTRIGRTETGLLATLGIATVRVKRPVCVAIISTGSELTDVGKPLDKGRIYNSIRYILGTSIRQEHLTVGLETDCPDDEQAITDCIRQAISCADVVITTGGVSVGKKDLIPAILDKMGAKRLFYNVNIQPGTPTLASLLEDKVILSLSGNPYAAMANFDVYFWNIVSVIMGSVSFLPYESEAILADDHDKINRMRRLIRAYEEGGKVFLPVREHMSSVFGNTTQCNCYIDLPAGCRISAGDKVKIRKMGPNHE